MDVVMSIGRAYGYEFEPEYPFARMFGRRWRFDYADVRRRVAVEVEGGLWIQGRHTRARGYMRDIEKYNAAAAMGWIVIRVAAHRVRRDLPVALESLRRYWHASARDAIVAAIERTLETPDAMDEQEKAALLTILKFVHRGEKIQDA